jgi:hypothetical protein
LRISKNKMRHDLILTLHLMIKQINENLPCLKKLN